MSRFSAFQSQFEYVVGALQSVAVSAVAQSAYAFGNMAIGAADPSRYIMCAVSTVGGTANAHPSSVSIQNIAASQVASYVNGLAKISLWLAPVPNDTTATVVVVYAANEAKLSVSTWSLLNLNPLQLIPATAQSGLNTFTASLQPEQSGNCVIGICVSNGTATHVWSGSAAEVYDAIVSGTTSHSGAIGNSPISSPFSGGVVRSAATANDAVLFALWQP